MHRPIRRGAGILILATIPIYHSACLERRMGRFGCGGKLRG